MPTVKTQLANSVPDATKSTLDTKLADPNAQGNYVASTVGTAGGTTAMGAPATPPITVEQIKGAVKSALDDTTGAAVPVEPTFTNPTKLSLTSIMTTFMNSINSLPIMNTLRGISISATGSSVLCLNMPGKYGGNRCWDASNIQGTLNLIGTALLSIVTLLSFIYIFKG
jgi:hypothetical protein